MLNPLLTRCVLATATLTLLACGNGQSLVVDRFNPALTESIEIDSVEPEPPLGYALPARGSIFSKTREIGGSVGETFEVACETDQVLAGVAGRAGALIDQVSALCVDVDDSGNWVGTPQQKGPAYGGGGGSAFTQRCPLNHGVTGFTANMQRNLTGYLQIHCRSLTDSNNASGELTALNAVGTAGGISPKILCADQAVAKGIYGAANSLVGRFGLTCIENPAYAGRWSNVIDWPLIAIHAVVTPTGSVMTFGSTADGRQGAQFNYDVWDPLAGTSPQSHMILDSTLGVDSFCSAAMVMPDNGNILMAGGDDRPNQRVNTGIADAPIFNTTTNSLSRAANMSFERWYPTATALPNGDVMLIGGINGARQHSVTPEVYSPETDEWRSLLGISTAGYNYTYPRQWVVEDGRLFGINQNKMYYLTTEGAGSLTPAGTLPNVALGASSTAVMYAPGKILQVAGYGSDGTGAITVDVNGADPVVRTVESMAQPREFWSNSLVLPDGKVLVLGGSQINYNLPTAALGAELWDPATERWTQMSRSQLARLYHSTSVLLRDGTVLLAGGGAPGPLTNRNAEIFSPPYLFDENGALKSRPQISIAPDFAAYGQTIPVGVSTDEISRVTLIKASSVTHSWNMEQRFIELDFSASNGRIDVVLPASANLATPGYYMLFVLDETGTPSVGHMLKMGTEPAPEIVIEPPTPEPPTETPGNLLQNGGFELAKASWNDCGDGSLTTPKSDASDGAAAMGVSTGGCLYQEVSVTPGIEYSFTCDAAIGAAGYASIFLQINDSSYAELALEEQQIIGDDYTQYQGTLVAPDNAAFASLGMYSEGVARYDRCALVAGTQTVPEPPPTEPPVPRNSSLLLNGGFEQQKNGWFDCSSNTLSRASDDALAGTGALEITNAGCLYQEVQIAPGTPYRFHCSAKSEGTAYTSMTVQITNANRTELQAVEVPIGNSVYKSYETTLTAPADSVHSALTLYSEDPGTFDNCFIEAL